MQIMSKCMVNAFQIYAGRIPHIHEDGIMPYMLLTLSEILV